MKRRGVTRLAATAFALLFACSSAFCAFAMEDGTMGDYSANGAFLEDEILINAPTQTDQDDQAAFDAGAALGETEYLTETPEEMFEELETDTESDVPDAIQEQTQPVSYPQLTAEDIVRLDNGDAELLYDEEGRVTFIRGRYSPEKVLNYEDAVASLNYVSSLLGLTKGALFFCVYKGIDYTTGYTSYLFLQRDGDVTVVNASIKIYVDPDGYTAALSCSFNPATGIREETAGSIDAGDAEQIVRETFPDQELMVYSGETGQAGILEEGQNQHVWSVFTNNPEMHSGGSDLPFLQHFVSYSGEYLMNLPCSTTKAPLLQTDDALERRAKAMFEGYDKETWTGDVTLHDGSKLRLTVPVARSRADGRYYLMDLDRMMLVADYREVFYGSGQMVISSSDTNSGWKDKELLAMYNIGRVYDYFNDHGYRSVDGSGIPLAILSGVCDANGAAVDNAFFSGFQDGFGIFAISDVNNSVECLDIMGHEFTHGITSYSMGGSSYINELGAINEAYSDIMGNLCELTYSVNDLSIAAGRTDGQFDVTGTSTYGSSEDSSPSQPDWRIGEMGGKIYRDMSNPVAFRQPAFVGDAYYCLPAGQLNNAVNDYGGVHENSSLLGSVAWVLNQHGLTYERQYSLWMTAMNMMTPKSDYDDVLQALIFARKTYGWEEEIDTWLTEAFAQRGLLENCRSYSKEWDGTTFAAYHADQLTVLDQTQAQTENSDPVTEELNSLLTGGSSENAIAAQGAVTGSQTDPSLEEKEDNWLDGVGLDSEGRIARKGFGRIDLDTLPEDRTAVIGAAILKPYTYETIAVNCPDENGHVSFLLPEGVYWVTLCVCHGGPSQTVFWPYNQAGGYEQMGPLTVFGEVEVKAGQATILPPGDVQ